MFSLCGEPPDESLVGLLDVDVVLEDVPRRHLNLFCMASAEEVDGKGERDEGDKGAEGE